MIEKGLTSWDLKCLAIITMLIDHTGAVLFPHQIFLRVIGRAAFPIFGFLLIQGFKYTHDLKSYNNRLWLFALLSEIPFDLAVSGKILDFSMQNIFFTLSITLLMLRLIQNGKQHLKKAFVMIGCLLLGDFLQADYGAVGMLYMLLIYEAQTKYARNSARWISTMAAFVLISLQVISAFPQINSALSLLVSVVLAMPIYFYNGQKGRNMKYFFYIFYPVHLLILYSLDCFRIFE